MYVTKLIIHVIWCWLQLPFIRSHYHRSLVIDTEVCCYLSQSTIMWYQEDIKTRRKLIRRILGTNKA